jgi:hypothetical protein
MLKLKNLHLRNINLIGIFCTSTDNLQFATKTALVGSEREKIFKGKLKKSTVTKICVLPKIDIDY